MSHPRVWPLPWLCSRDEIQINAPKSLVVPSILMVCAEHKKTVQHVGWKSGKQLKSILLQQRLPGEELGVPCRCPPPGWEGQGDQALYSFLISLLPRSTRGPGLLRVCTDVGGHAHCMSLGPCFPSPGAEGLAWQWTTVALTRTLLSSLLLGQRWPQPTPARFPNDLSTLRSSGGRSCQPSVLLVFPACCSRWH